MLVLVKHIYSIGKKLIWQKSIYRYVKGKLPTNKPSTIGVEFATKNVDLRNGGGIVKAQIWDTGKQTRVCNMI